MTVKPEATEDEEFGDEDTGFYGIDRCTHPAGHSWVYDDSGHGEGRCYCEWCGADGDA